MSSKSRRKNISVIETLTECPYKFSFKQAVRLLECSTAHRMAQANKMTNNPIAQYMPPSSEFVRFNTAQSFSFPSSDISSIKPTTVNSKIKQWKMNVNFIGLTGQSGVLPYHYTETALQRLKLKDNSMSEFFNLFNHRTISLFYQSSCKYNFPIEYERKRLNSTPGQDTDNYTKALLSLIGFGTINSTKHLYTKDESFIYYSGLFTNKVRTASGLRQILQNHFSIPVQIKEFVGQWQDLIHDVLTRLPGTSNLGQNHCLGKTAMLGKKGWFAQMKVSIILGPLNKSQLDKFSPGTTTLKALDEIVELYLGNEHDYDFIMRIKKKDIPQRTSLSTTRPTIIGWTAWLPSKAERFANSEETIDIPVSSRRFR